VISEQGRLKSLFEEDLSNQNRQSLPVTYITNGAIYAFRACDFIQRGGFPSNGSLPYIMSADDSVDIDSESDLRVAAEILERNGG
jgi:CMP-N-acetylneuraminic acid synthetase